MAVLGHNPARIIPAWRQFVDDNVGYGRPLRGIGEPIWAGRRASELLECQFHEALLNVALDANTPLWLRCPYDIRALAPDVITEARRSHPHTSGRDDQSGSGIYGGSAHPERLFSGELDEPRAEPDVLEFDAASRDSVGQFVIRRALRAGLPAARTADLALAISELARDSTSDRQAHGVLRVWRDDSSFVCEVADGRPTRDLLVGRVAPGQSASADRQSAWLANRLCDLVQIRSHETGSVVRVLTWI
jgi:anti-sigma regulatory factor (Ser/Thr protein kinase)